MQELFDKSIFTYIMVSLCAFGVLLKLVLEIVYSQLIKASDNMGTAKNKLTLMMKLKFETCYKLKIGVNNVDIFVDKHVYRHRFCGILLSTWENIGGQILMLCLLIGSISAVLGLIYECGKQEILSTFSVGILTAGLLIFLEGIINLAGKKELIRLNMKDYLENFFKVRLEQELLHPEMLEQYRREFLMKEEQKEITPSFAADIVVGRAELQDKKGEKRSNAIDIKKMDHAQRKHKKAMAKATEKSEKNKLKLVMKNERREEKLALENMKQDKRQAIEKEKEEKKLAKKDQKEAKRLAIKNKKEAKRLAIENKKEAKRLAIEKKKQEKALAIEKKREEIEKRRLEALEAEERMKKEAKLAIERKREEERAEIERKKAELRAEEQQKKDEKYRQEEIRKTLSLEKKVEKDEKKLSKDNKGMEKNDKKAREYKTKAQERKETLLKEVQGRRGLQDSTKLPLESCGISVLNEPAEVKTAISEIPVHEKVGQEMVLSESIDSQNERLEPECFIQNKVAAAVALEKDANMKDTNQSVKDKNYYSNKKSNTYSDYNYKNNSNNKNNISKNNSNKMNNSNNSYKTSNSKKSKHLDEEKIIADTLKEFLA